MITHGTLFSSSPIIFLRIETGEHFQYDWEYEKLIQ